MKIFISLVAFLHVMVLSSQTNFAVSFKLLRNLMVVNAVVDGKEGYFLLDTGVPDVILNKRMFSGLTTGEKYSGINGVEAEKEIRYISIDLGGWSNKTMAIVTNLNALEKSLGIVLAGVIGNNLFKNCEVVFDYILEEVMIYQLDKRGNRLASKEIPQVPEHTFHFFQTTRIPYLEVSLGGHQLKMGLDSGASVNVMERPIIDLIPQLTSQILKDSLVSFGASKTLVSSLIVPDITVGNITCPPMKTSLVHLDHLNQNRSGVILDGLLGYPFLSNFRVGLNFRKWEIYLWDHELTQTQWLAAGKIEVHE